MIKLQRYTTIFYKFTLMYIMIYELLKKKELNSKYNSDGFMVEEHYYKNRYEK